jgi:PAS domain S-box-containing protein
VAVVKISLDPLERVWQRSGYPVVLRDSRGVVFLSAVPEWLFHSIAPVSAADSKWISEHGQYGTRARFDPLPWKIKTSKDTPGFTVQTRCTAAAPTCLRWIHRCRNWAGPSPSPRTCAMSSRPKAPCAGHLGRRPAAAGGAVLALARTPLCRAAGGPAGTGTAWKSAPATCKKPTLRKAMEDSLLVGMRARDPEGTIIYVNPALCAMVGYSAEELLGRRPPYPYWHPEDLEKQARESEDALQGRAAPSGFESRIRHKDGHDVITMVYTAPLIDAEGVNRGWMSSVVDITAQKQAEARQRDQEVRLQRARLASVGEMASTLAHELNQPLMALSNFAVAARALAGRASPDMLAGALDDIIEQARRASEIVRRVR